MKKNSLEIVGVGKIMELGFDTKNPVLVTGGNSYVWSWFTCPGIIWKSNENLWYSFYTAAPFNWKYTDAAKEFYHPVVDGTKNVLETVNKTKSIKTVIYNSSGFAVCGDNADIALTPGSTLNEDCWNTSSTSDHNPRSYCKATAKNWLGIMLINKKIGC